MKDKFSFCLKNLLSIIRSIFFNLRVLPFKYALRMPILINWRVKVHCKRGHIKFKNKPKTFSVKLGINGSDTIPTLSRGYLNINGEMIFVNGENISFGKGFSLTISENGTLSMGDNVSFNKNSIIECKSKIDIGNDVLTGWNCTLLDSTNHCVYYSDRKSKIRNYIKIQNHVWFGAHVTILNGTTISKNSVVGYGAIVQGDYPECVLINQGKASIIKDGVSWGYKNPLKDNHEI